MKLTKKTNILIVGLGLLGGSYARAFSEQGYAVAALDTRPGAIEYGLSEGMICAGATAPDKALLGKADLVVLALYPHLVISWLREYQHLLSPGTCITDVTGVKGTIVGEVQALLRPDLEFIAAHPMAGREVGGVENSRADLFRDANYIVVPTEQNTEEGVALCEALGRALGFARISHLSPEEHDAVIGARRVGVNDALCEVGAHHIKILLKLLGCVNGGFFAMRRDNFHSVISCVRSSL